MRLRKVRFEKFQQQRIPRSERLHPSVQHNADPRIHIALEADSQLIRDAQLAVELVIQSDRPGVCRREGTQWMVERLRSGQDDGMRLGMLVEMIFEIRKPAAAFGGCRLLGQDARFCPDNIVLDEVRRYEAPDYFRGEPRKFRQVRLCIDFWQDARCSVKIFVREALHLDCTNNAEIFLPFTGLETSKIALTTGGTVHCQIVGNGARVHAAPA